MTTYSLNGETLNASVDIEEPYAARVLIETRFSETLTQAQEVLDLLIGEDADGGLIGEMEAALGSAPSPVITPETVDTSLTLVESGLSVPTFNHSSLQTAPSETYTEPTLVTVPTVDVDFTGIALPDDISVGMSWAEATLPDEVYTALRTQILADLVDGSTGITDTVEDAIYTRARNRQQAENLVLYNRANNTIYNLHHALPTGAGAALLVDFGIAQVRQEAETEAAIIEGQAKLAQENRRAAIQGALNLEQLIRQSRDGESTRALESAKALAQLIVQEYSEKIKAFQAVWDGKKAEVEAKVANVQAAIQTNTGLIDIFKALYDSLKTRVEAVSTYNKSLTDVFVAEVEGFSGAEKAIADRNNSSLKLLEQKIADADMDLRGQIAEANALVQAYTAETSIKERISSDRAQIAAQVAASLLSAVSASASLGYTGHESASKSFSVSVDGNESHHYQHEDE